MLPSLLLRTRRSWSSRRTQFCLFCLSVCYWKWSPCCSIAWEGYLLYQWQTSSGSGSPRQ